MIFISVPQRARLKIDMKVSAPNVDIDTILIETARAMDKVSKAVHIPLSVERTPDGVALWIIRLPNACVSRIRGSNTLRQSFRTSKVSAVVVASDEFSVSNSPPTDVSYLDSNGNPVASAVLLTDSTCNAILDEKNVDKTSEDG